MPMMSIGVVLIMSGCGPQAKSNYVRLPVAVRRTADIKCIVIDGYTRGNHWSVIRRAILTP